MWLDIIILVASLVIILLSCELFTNGIEWFGKRLKIGDGVVGSIFSAVGTCLPETMIPIIAILFSEKTQENIDVGIGAIVGAPFMLSTLAFFVTGLSVLVFRKWRKTGLVMRVDPRILTRDIGFFILIYTIGIGAAFIDIPYIRLLISVFLVVYYISYIVITVKRDHVTHRELEALYMVKLLKVKSRLSVILLQIVFALMGIVIGAELFVEGMQSVAHLLGIPALALSLILTPVATELPEKFNSILWISKRKDTLAMGNITGAMVFQSCIPVAIGIAFTSWNLDFKTVLSAMLAILSAGVTWLFMTWKGKLNITPLIAGGGFYLIFIVYLAQTVFAR